MISIRTKLNVIAVSAVILVAGKVVMDNIFMFAACNVLKQ